VIRELSETKKFILASNFPKMTYAEDLNQTLEEAGFFPNAALFLKGL
jgi:hypothetical protein